MGAERLEGCLTRLSDALIRLDHAAVADHAAELERIRQQIKLNQLDRNAIQQALSQLVRVGELAGGADRLYAGWARISAHVGAAYTPEGAEPELMPRPALRMEG